MKKNAKYKPLLFTTTIRNPKRIKGLLYILSKFNNNILTNDLAEKIMGELIKFGIYRPLIVTESIRKKWLSTKKGEFSELILTDKEVKFLLLQNPQSHKEAGFKKGWPSRFATIFDFAKELGFVYYKINEKIEFSEIGLKLANSIKIEIENDYILYSEVQPSFEKQAFLHALAKYQRNNPFVKVLNNNVPLILLLQVIKELNQDRSFNSIGISKLELPLLLYWKDNDYHKLYLRIKKLREEFGYSPSWEVIIDICQNEIMQGKDIVRNESSIMVDYPDEFIRKMRLTGLISLRGAGRFIDINKKEEKKVEYILEKYTNYPTFTSERDYFNYMAITDKNLITETSESIKVEENNKLLLNWVNYYSWETIKSEMLLLSKRRKSKDDILKYLSYPIRLEFLTAIAIKSKFRNVIVVPNYPVDDEGIPTSTAGGQSDKGDIECLENDNGILIEVTMSQGRTQTIMEVWPISRHLETFSKRVGKNSMCHFIAPEIYSDSLKQIRWLYDTERINIKARSIKEFINFLEENHRLFEK